MFSSIYDNDLFVLYDFQVWKHDKDMWADSVKKSKSVLCVSALLHKHLMLCR